ncbi:hypothetical protein Pres01_35650 [Metapseudomonas resinovorans]|uniref:XRE family transcriptional regulator n=1 Tax=Metapseudomonas resinovorans TaxID=53412 RepID=UPI0009859539|nr:S24 family peptidase [Pseudomonas resinovorans]GLZ87514.1 hypothetical protein Pres01_35650 [Pseudomonas resinovorans]
MDFPDRVKSRMQALQLSASELAQLVGVSKGSVTHWTTGTNKVSGKNLIALAKALECDVNWLASDEGRATAIGSPARASRTEEAKDATTAVVLEMLKKHAGKSLNSAAKQRIAQAVADSLSSSALKFGESLAAEPTGSTVREGDICIPHFDFQALANEAQAPADYSEFVRTISVSAQQLERLGIDYSSPANLSVITAWGQSMERIIKDKDLVLVDRGINKYVGDGIYLITWAGHLFIKRLQLAGTNQLELVSDNPTHKTRIVAMYEVKIHAKAVLIFGVNKP